MPKRKRATALFEVMSAGRTLEPVVKNRSWLHSPSLWAIFNRPKRPRPVEIQREPVPVHEPEPEAYEPESIAIPADSSPREPWVNRLKFNFKIDATNAVIAGSALVIVIGLTLLVASNFHGQKLPSLSAVSSVTEVRKQPTRPDVMDIPRRATATTVLPPEPAKSSEADDEMLARETAPLPAKRIINMNYVLVQIYDKEALAKDAADALGKAGISTTIIQGLPRWAANTKWYCVLGTKGFGPKATNSPEFDSYLQKIHNVNTAFAGKSKWKQFNPQLYKWGADNEKQ